jgi:hypothetical protein
MSVSVRPTKAEYRADEREREADERERLVEEREQEAAAPTFRPRTGLASYASGSWLGPPHEVVVHVAHSAEPTPVGRRRAPRIGGRSEPGGA